MAPARTGVDDALKEALANEEEEDYMSMAILEPSKPSKESSIQRQARKAREGELRGRVKSRQEREADEAAAREAALATSLDPSNKGFQMMAKLGYKAGSTLGKNLDGHQGARTEPIALVMKDDRGGIGLDNEKKRKFREETQHEAKRVKAEEGEYRDRVRREREEKRLEGQIIGAQKVVEKLDTEAAGEVELAISADQRPTEQKEPSGEEHNGIINKDAHSPRAAGSRPVKHLNVLWRGLVRYRLEKERERRMRYDLQQSLSRLPTYEDPDEEKEDKLALGREEEELEEDDAELDEFNDLEPAERLKRLVTYLRDTYHYCFWCKFRYPDATLDGCPGLTEDEHG